MVTLRYFIGKEWSFMEEASDDEFRPFVEIENSDMPENEIFIALVETFFGEDDFGTDIYEFKPEYKGEDFTFIREKVNPYGVDI